MVDTFHQGAILAEQFDPESSSMKAIIEAVPESRRHAFLAMARDADIRKMSVAFNRAVGKYWNDVCTAKEAGNIRVYHTFNVAPEIFHALDGVTPVCLEILNTMTMTLEEGIHPYLDLAVERGLPDSICSSQRAFVGLLEAGLIEKPDLLVGSLGGCDSQSKIYEYMSERFDIPLICIETPYYSDARALSYYRSGFKALVRTIEDMTGHKLNPDRLREVCEQTNQATELFMEMDELKRHVPNPVPNHYNMQHLAAKVMIAGIPDAVDYYQPALDVCMERLSQGKHVMPEEKIRLMFLYTAFYFDNSLYSWFEEEQGVSYLTDLPVFYDFNPVIDTSSVETMLDGLAEETFNMPMTRQRKGGWDMAANWLDDVLHYAETYKATALVFAGHVACKHAWGVHRLVADEVKTRLGIPSLRLEGDSWDSRITPMPAIRAQFEEFFTTLTTARAQDPGAKPSPWPTRIPARYRAMAGVQPPTCR